MEFHNYVNYAVPQITFWIPLIELWNLMEIIILLIELDD